jgi:hypothetical protein
VDIHPNVDRHLRACFPSSNDTGNEKFAGLSTKGAATIGSGSRWWLTSSDIALGIVIPSALFFLP